MKFNVFVKALGALFLSGTRNKEEHDKDNKGNDKDCGRSLLLKNIFHTCKDI